MKKRVLGVLLSSLFLVSFANSAFSAETTHKHVTKEDKKEIKSELKKHPRIKKAIKELEEAVKYLQAAPDDFGGHKAKAIESSKKAIEDLKKALEFRAEKDEKKKEKKEDKK